MSQIDVSDPHDAVVMLDGDTALLRLGESDFVERLQQYLELGDGAARARVRASTTSICGLSERLYVRPAKGSAQGAGDGAGTAVGWNGGSVAQRERYVVGLDIGTSKVCTVVGEIVDDGGLDIIGIGMAESKGLKRGVVVNLEAAVESIKKSIEEAELMAGVEIGSVHLGISGPHIKGFNSRGVVAVAGKNREVTREDVRRAIDAARAVSLPAGREIIHVLPQDFVVDEQEGIGDPVGLTGARLEVNVHIVTGSSAANQNLVSCVNRAGVAVSDTVISQLAAAEAVLTDDEKSLGVAMVDIGGGTADLAIFERGSLWHTAVVAVGGDHFTNDIAVGLRTPIPEAEKVKRRVGCALSGMVDEDETIEVASVGGRRPRVMARRILSDILQPGPRSCSISSGTRSARPVTRSHSTRASCSPVAVRCSKACRRLPSRFSTCPSVAACPREWAAWRTTSGIRRTRRPWDWCAMPNGIASPVTTTSTGDSCA